MRYLGIDYGSKRIGVAISDEAGVFAFPLKVLENKGNSLKDISAICLENKIGEIIVGESLNFAQEDNDVMKEIIPFVEELKKKTGLKVSLHPEFMTSQEAERLQGKNDMHDASAAALILKSYLDTNVQKN